MRSARHSSRFLKEPNLPFEMKVPEIIHERARAGQKSHERREGPDPDLMGTFDVVSVRLDRDGVFFPFEIEK